MHKFTLQSQKWKSAQPELSLAQIPQSPPTKKVLFTARESKLSASMIVTLCAGQFSGGGGGVPCESRVLLIRSLLTGHLGAMLVPQLGQANTSPGTGKGPLWLTAKS